MLWIEIKDWLELSTGLDRNSLHIYAGVGIQLVVAWLFRRSLASAIPWMFVVVAALVNEFLDYLLVPARFADDQQYFDGAFRDIWNSLLLPSLFLVIARFWPAWLTGTAEANGEPVKLESDESSL